MHEISILKGSGANKVASRSRHVRRKLLIRISIDTVGPIILDMFQMRVVRNPSSKPNGGIRILP
jgi:hypothetical protein